MEAERKGAEAHLKSCEAEQLLTQATELTQTAVESRAKEAEVRTGFPPVCAAARATLQLHYVMLTSCCLPQWGITTALHVQLLLQCLGSMVQYSCYAISYSRHMTAGAGCLFFKVNHSTSVWYVAAREGSSS